MRPLLLILCLTTFTITARADDTPSATLSPDDAVAYIDVVVKKWIEVNPNHGKIDLQSAGALVADVQRVGVTSLIAAYRITAPDTGYRVNVPLDQKEELKRAVLEKALSATASSSDINTLLAVYDERPLILEVFTDHADWDSNASVTDFLAAHLQHDPIAAAYQKSDLAPLHLLLLAARSHAADVADKFDGLLSDITQNSTSYKNTHLFTHLIAVNGLMPNTIIPKHLPDLLVTLASRAHFPPSDIYNDVQSFTVFSPQLMDWAIAHPTTFTDPATKDAMLKLVDAASNGTPNANALIVAAVCGRKEALVQLSTTNSPQAKKYLAAIPNIAAHIDAAVYDPAACTWTFPPNATISGDPQAR
jgi:hypothetical protein